MVSFRVLPLSYDLDFLELILSSLSNCFNGGYLFVCPFFLDIHRHYEWLLLSLVGNRRFLSLHCMDGGRVKLRYCPVKVGFRYTNVLNP